MSHTELAVLRFLVARAEWGYASMPYSGTERMIFSSVYATKEAAIAAKVFVPAAVFVLRAAKGQPPVAVWIISDEELESLGPCPNVPA